MKYTLQTQKNIQLLSWNFLNKFVEIKSEDDFDFNEVTDFLKRRGVFIENSEKFDRVSLEICFDVIESNSLSTGELSKTFYETFGDIKSKARFELFVDQIRHYNTTYGGDDSNGIYTPNKQELPVEVLKNIKYIQTISLEEFKNSLKEILTSNIALKSDDVKMLSEILEIFPELLDLVHNIQNKELKTFIYLNYGKVPKDPEELLRVIFLKCMDNSLYIKSEENIQMLKEQSKFYRAFILDYFRMYIRENGIEKLAQVFNRNKKVFLALKGEKEINTLINKISKVSKYEHKPKVTPDYLLITSGKFTENEAQDIMEKMDTSYLIKLANTLYYNNQNTGVKIYNIRNGKYFVKAKVSKDLSNILENCLEIIKNRMNKQIQEHKIILKESDNGLNLALPTSLKQFTGNIPWFSRVNAGKNDVVAGIFWENIGDNSIDLDLSCTNAIYKIGWDSSFEQGNTRFSGDMTDAQNGAVEVFSIKDGMYIMNVNYFNHSPSLKPEFKFFIGKKYNSDEMKMVDPNNIIFSTEMEMDTQSKSIGFIDNGNFIFGELRNPDKSSEDVSNEDLITAIQTQIYSKILFSDLELKSYNGKDGIELDLGNPEKSLLLKLLN